MNGQSGDLKLCVRSAPIMRYRLSVGRGSGSEGGVVLIRCLTRPGMVEACIAVPLSRA
jgi:hypothetical protein